MTGRVRTAYGRLGRWLPRRLTERLEASALHPAGLMDRVDLRRALRSGPPFRPSHRGIVIDITTACDVRCTDCNRSCGAGQAPAEEHMALEQVERFVAESIAAGRRWSRISIEGGEPTLHPRWTEIAALLADYRDRFSPWTHLQLVTNGAAAGRAAALRRRGILVWNMRKTSPRQPGHCAFNVAPCDTPRGRDKDCSGGCYLPVAYGLGLTRHGYYPHPICGGIDRVFGFDIGRKRLPERGDELPEHFGRLCRLCGFLFHNPGRGRRTPPSEGGAGRGPRMTESWRHAYARYRQRPPTLTPY